jgi:thiamine biosynthesis protein ThiS
MILVNDVEQPWHEGVTVLEVLRALDPNLPIAVVRLNGAHLPRAAWETRTLQDGDDVRVVYIIAGG